MRNPRRTSGWRARPRRCYSPNDTITIDAAARWLRLPPRVVADLVREGVITGGDNRVNALSVAEYDALRWRLRRQGDD